jgi:hypothetical protein
MQRIQITKELTYQNIWKSGTCEMNKIMHNLSRTPTMLFANLVKWSSTKKIFKIWNNANSNDGSSHVLKIIHQILTKIEN